MKRTFAGFVQPSYTQVPNQLFDELLPDLSGAELKVVLYVVRRTFGFQKNVDAISTEQLLHGVRKQDGTVLDKGTGLTRGTLRGAINSLVEKGILLTEKRFGKDGGSRPTAYKLALEGGIENRPPPPTENQYPPPPENRPPQKKVLQKTDLQKEPLFPFPDPIKDTAERIHKRHPKRKCSKAIVEKKLTKICGKNGKFNQKLLTEIDESHQRWCNSDGWNNNGGMYCKSLEAWLNPEAKRWEEQPDVFDSPGNLPEFKGFDWTQKKPYDPKVDE